MPVEKSLADEAHGTADRCSRSAPRGTSWRCLGPTSEARAKAEALGGGGTGHEEDICLASVRAWTDRAAVDLRRLDAREECAIEPRITGQACPIALLAIDDPFDIVAIGHVEALRLEKPTTESDSGQRVTPNYAIRDAARHFTESLSVSRPTISEYARGALFGLAAVSIWSGWIVAARLGLKTSLTPWDITAIRFGI
jgi:hypothetical protein